MVCREGKSIFGVSVSEEQIATPSVMQVVRCDQPVARWLADHLRG